MALSTLTTSTLISGYKDDSGEDQSLLPKLDGKLLIIKDFTPILTSNHDRRMELLGQLRDAYDGQSARAFGVGGVREYRSTFALLAACTPVIEQHSGAMQPLGERFLRFQPKSGKATDKIKRALSNVYQEPEMRDELAQAAQGVLAGALKRPPKLWKKDNTLLVDLSNLLAVARTEVPRSGYNKEVLSIPLPEVGGRVGKQLLRLMHGIAMLHKHTSIGPHEFAIAQRVAFDSLPSKRRSILRTLYASNDGLPLSDGKDEGLAERIPLPTTTARFAVEDMKLLGLVKTTTVEKKIKRGNTVKVLTCSLVKEYRDAIDRIRRYTHRDF